MRLKKVAFVSAGVTTALLAASPLAFAGDAPDGAVSPAHTDPGSKGGGHEHGTKIDLSKTCGFQGGDTATNGAATGILAGVAQIPVAGNNVANLANCSDFLNNNLNHNLSDNKIAIGDNLLP